jgi:aspartyl-tRNA(Asn)/glutamyl-tRNA(Gln) amidotransferase subunit B
MRSADEARAYVTELRGVLVATGASDGKMEEGSLRVDANVSVRPGPDAPFGTRCEIKNLNSLRSLGRAIEYEAARQIQILTEGGTVAQETRHWHEGEGRTVGGRSKEEAYDYRYFPEPDLVPVVPDEAWTRAVREQLPELPAARRERLAGAAGVAPAAAALVVELELDALVHAAIAAGGDARVALNRAGNEVAADIDAARRLDSGAFASLVRMESKGELTPTQAKQVLAQLLAEGGDPAEIAKARGFEAMAAGALDSVVDQLIADHPAEWERFKGGDGKMKGFFVGKVMAATNKQANGKEVNALLDQRAAQ